MITKTKSSNFAEVGRRVRKLRLRQQLTLGEVAKQCGFTLSLLSKIETGRSVPPLGTLDNIAKSLGVTISHLLGDTASHETVFTPAAAPQRLTKTEKGYAFYAFAPGRADKLMQPFLLVAERGRVPPQRMSHRGEEFLYVLEGRMRYRVGPSEFTLGPGDSLYFDSENPHELEALTPTVRFLGMFIDPPRQARRGKGVQTV